MVNFILFILSTIGFTNIIVDPATIFKPIRDFVDKNGPKFLVKLVSCYQCTGTWVGFFCGYCLIGQEIHTVFLCGMAGSYICSLSATFINYLEIRSVIGLNENE